MFWRTLLNLAVLAAFLPIIISVASPPFPQDALVRVHVVELITDYFLQDVSDKWQLWKPSLVLSFGDSTFNATIKTIDKPVLVIEGIANTNEEYSYEGLKSKFQAKRDNIAIADWVNEEFGNNQNIGGQRFRFTNTSQTFELSNDSKNLKVDYTDITLIAEVFVGALEGKLQLSRVVVATDGNVFASSNGQPVLVTEEESFRFQRAVCESVLKEFLEGSVKYQNQNYVFESKALKNVVMDNRFTDHPIIGEKSAEGLLVGRWVYDELGLDTVDHGLFWLDRFFETMKPFQQKVEYELGSQTYEEVFNVYDNQDPTNTAALESEENAEESKGILKLWVKEDHLNTFFDVVIKTGVTEVKLSKESLSILDINADDLLISELDDPSNNISVTFKLENVTNSFVPGGFRQDIRFKINYNGLIAVYDVQNEMRVLYKNKKLAFDVLKLKVSKKADENFPRLLTTEIIKMYFDHQLDTWENFITYRNPGTKESSFSFEDKCFVMTLL